MFFVETILQSIYARMLDNRMQNEVGVSATRLAILMHGVQTDGEE
jgi:hypothetical protein